MTPRPHWLLPSSAYKSYGAYREAVGGGAVEAARARALTPDAVVEIVRQSGLRGRGGAGLPTGVKWRAIATHVCPTRYVVCNAAEGEPGTFKDRALLRKNPYAVLEGILIATRAVDAKKAFVAVKASFKPELERLRGALQEMRSLLEPDAITIVEGPEE